MYRQYTRVLAVAQAAPSEVSKEISRITYPLPLSDATSVSSRPTSSATRFANARATNRNTKKARNQPERITPANTAPANSRRV